ncbi:thyrostimulin beta-5 subunit [Episyrphus balteatus]|uniref:thyrostimulin beta-5 subunit n=1 Tax=Episyrphus balteatus TaxID=286459 RepID=UPI0024851026|nr:thyrostimulin beta-5 subunit [Episyrphus balteatus]
MNGELLFIFSAFLCISKIVNGSIEVESVGEDPTPSPLGCHRRMYTYRVTQSDAQGRECWDLVNVMSCWGRCDSSEISDWKFPYKKAHHPVCVHAARAPAVAVLKNCHPEASLEIRKYEYMEAVSCHCHTCSSLDTACEAPGTNILEEKTGVKILALSGADSTNLDYEY